MTVHTLPLPRRAKGGVALTPALLRQLLDYDPATGVLTWRPRTADMFVPGRRSSAAGLAGLWNGKHAGKEALSCRGSHGYPQGKIWGKTYRSHRVVWAIVTGSWPTEEIDHINGVKHDNRWGNLRAVSRVENGRNLGLHANNTSGHIGVHWDGKARKWRASIKVSGRCLNLGTFPNIEDAICARKKAEAKHGFHPNHGARPSHSIGLETAK